MSNRIRWGPNSRGGFLGHVGTAEPWAFQIWKPGDETLEWRLISALFGQHGRRFDNDDSDTLKAEAERWLEEFACSLGAVFPEPGFEFDDDDGEPLEVKYASGNRVRFMHPDYGYPGEQQPAADLLVLGAVYTIATCQVGQSRTDLMLEGIPGEWFNSVFFEPATTPDTTPPVAGDKE